MSVNARAAVLVDKLKSACTELKVGVSSGESGETLIDAGARQTGSIAAGLLIAEICMGGLGTVELANSSETPRWPWTLMVRSSNPVTACLASQYAGWRLTGGEGKQAFFALASGPGRALARKEKLFDELGYQDRAEHATLVLEASGPPPSSVVQKVAQDCGVTPDRLSFIYTPTQSLAGNVQIVARVLEVALHKAHELHFPLERIVEGMGAAPLSPPHPDMITAMGRTNARARRAAAEPHVARLWGAVRGDLQALQGGLLRNRSDVVQPGASQRHRHRKRPDLPQRPYRFEAPRCLIHLTASPAGLPHPHRASPSSVIASTGMRAS
jgi:methenyltetrahydromethanopterin cyclohydrolase